MSELLPSNPSGELANISQMRQLYQREISILTQNILDIDSQIEQIYPYFSKTETELLFTLSQKYDALDKLETDLEFQNLFHELLLTKEDVTEQDLIDLRVIANNNTQEKLEKSINESLDIQVQKEVEAAQKLLKPIFLSLLKILHPDQIDISENLLNTSKETHAKNKVLHSAYTDATSRLTSIKSSTHFDTVISVITEVLPDTLKLILVNEDDEFFASFSEVVQSCLTNVTSLDGEEVNKIAKFFNYIKKDNDKKSKFNSSIIRTLRDRQAPIESLNTPELLFQISSLLDIKKTKESLLQKLKDTQAAGSPLKDFQKELELLSLIQEIDTTINTTKQQVINLKKTNQDLREAQIQKQVEELNKIFHEADQYSNSLAIKQINPKTAELDLFEIDQSSEITKHESFEDLKTFIPKVIDCLQKTPNSYNYKCEISISNDSGEYLSIEYSDSSINISRSNSMSSPGTSILWVHINNEERSFRVINPFHLQNNYTISTDNSEVLNKIKSVVRDTLKDFDVVLAQ